MVNESLTTRPPAFFVRMHPEVGCDPRVSVSADRLNGPPTSLGRPLVSPDFMGRDEPGHLTGRPRRAILEASFRKEQRRLIFRPIDDSQSRVTVGVGATQKRGPIFETGKRPGQRAYSKDGNLHSEFFAALSQAGVAELYYWRSHAGGTYLRICPVLRSGFPGVRKWLFL